MTLEEKAESYTTEAVLHGRAGIDSVTEAYRAGYGQAVEDMKCCGNCMNRDEPCKTAGRCCTSWEQDHGI